MVSKTNSHVKVGVAIESSRGLTINWSISTMMKGRRLCSEAKKILIAIYEYFGALKASTLVGRYIVHYVRQFVIQVGDNDSESDANSAIDVGSNDDSYTCSCDDWAHSLFSLLAFFEATFFVSAFFKATFLQKILLGLSVSCSCNMLIKAFWHKQTERRAKVLYTDVTDGYKWY